MFTNPRIFFLELLLVEPVLEEGEHRLLLPVDLPVVAEDDHPVRVHGLAGEELQVLELAQEAGHGRGDVLLEVGNLAGFGGNAKEWLKRWMQDREDSTSFLLRLSQQQYFASLFFELNYTGLCSFLNIEAFSYQYAKE